MDHGQRKVDESFQKIATQKQWNISSEDSLVLQLFAAKIDCGELTLVFVKVRRRLFIAVYDIWHRLEYEIANEFIIHCRKHQHWTNRKTMYERTNSCS